MATTQLARQCVQQLTPYQSARRIGGHGHIWLNANESPDNIDYPNPEQRLNRYPEFQPPELISAYANYANITPDQVLATRGADEAIDLLIRTYCEPGQDRVVINPPTYGMYAISAQTFGVEVVEQPVDVNFDPDYAALAKIDAKLIFICSPNNPTGNLIDLAKLEVLALAQQDKALIVVDEAYIEFSAQASAISRLSQFDNIVILRTLSKAFALAGARCGFVLGNAAVIQCLSKVIAPYPIPTPVAKLAELVLTRQLASMKQRVEALNQQRLAFKQQLEVLPGVEYLFNATGNFILIRFKQELFSAIAEKGIVLRNFTDKARLERCIRVSIGNPQEMATTLEAIRAFCQATCGEICL
ncbi:histidinol-phosphate transaminase [Celerinatantimonas yamalensis]|uniref:Histidinol-phosphate aminotransferase n=1 Tax=Celerinatantimonas yamalensis TaxID=559956 RepID=A0ABW9G2W8_9GAMM